MRLSLITALTVAIVAVLTAASIAVRSVSRIWLRHWVERRLRGAPIAELYLERPQRLIVSAGTGVALTVFLAGAAIGAGSPTLPEVAWRVVAVALVVLGLGQLLPRAVARRWPAPLVPVLVPILRVVDAVVMPMRWIGALVARPLRPLVAPSNADDDHRNDIAELLREGAREGVGQQEEFAIITGVVQFAGKRVREAMTPRDDVFAVYTSESPEAVTQRIAGSKYSRIPVAGASLDDVVGMVHAFDVLKTGGDAWPPIRAVAPAVSEMPCSDLLFSMLRTRRHLAVVRDEAGAMLGIVTLEDLLEELVGEIRDEHDEPEPRPLAT